MGNDKRLGVYFGNNTLYFVETRDLEPTNLFKIPLDEISQELPKNVPKSVGNLSIGTNIQKILSAKGIPNSSIVNLSLPAKDIIFRSFTIPWMDQHEIKSVVEFEASKYIPFSLEKLSFAFHPITFTENNNKRIRIIFVAIKSDVLSHHMKILENASLRINVIEPAPSSIIRALRAKLQDGIPQEETIALIEKDNVGRITIVDSDIPQFVREFQFLSAVAPQDTEISSEDFTKILTREVRISLDYFNRQSERLKVERGILLSVANSEELSNLMQSALHIAIAPVNDKLILGDLSANELSYLNAYGASVINTIGLPIHFNLSDKSPERKKFKLSIQKKPINYTSIIKTALVCVPLIISTIVFTTFSKQDFKNKIADLNEKLGLFQGSDTSAIQQQKNDMNEKLQYYKSIRMSSDTAKFLELIPPLLPESTWIDKLDVEYDDSSTYEFPKKDTAAAVPVRQTRIGMAAEALALRVTISGYVYSENRNQQFRLVNQFLQNLKNSKDFSDYFSSINIDKTNAQELEEAYPVTAFEIICKKSHEPQRPQ